MKSSTAVPAVCKLLQAGLLRHIDSYLTIGSLCRRDYERENRCSGERISVLIDMLDPVRGTCSFDLTQQTVDINIPDIAMALTSPALLDADCQRVAGVIAAYIDRALFSVLTKFPSTISTVHTDLTVPAIDEADRLLFDAGSSNKTCLAINSGSWHKFTQSNRTYSGSFEVCTPSPDDEPWLRTAAIFDPLSLCLVTRRLLSTEPKYVQHVEDREFGLTLIATENDVIGKSITVQVNLLFAVGITRNELGVRIPIPDMEQVCAPISHADQSIGLESAVSEARSAAPVDPCASSPAAALCQVTANTVVERFLTTMDSLADSIPDESAQLRTALRLLERVDGITVAALVAACNSQLSAVSVLSGQFTDFLGERRRQEIETREKQVIELDVQAAELRGKLTDLSEHRLTILSQIDNFKDDIMERQLEFEEAARDTRNLVERRLALIGGKTIKATG